MSALKYLLVKIFKQHFLIPYFNKLLNNIFFHGLGVLGWTYWGYTSKDNAILVNFGLQIPLFLIGYINLMR